MPDLSHILEARIDLIKKICYQKSTYYKKFYIPKSFGEREILAPNWKLKQIQRNILKRIIHNLRVSNNAHGFVEERSIITNSLNHTKKRVVYKLDIVNFFPSIGKDRIHEIFYRMGLPGFASDYLTELVTFEDILPQGAPTSPHISNIVCRKLDFRLSGVAKFFSLKYSRYADDITFSGEEITGGMVLLIKKIISEEGFTVNDKKTRVMSSGTRQVVTGMVVNDKVWIGRKKYRILRAFIHRCVQLNLGFYKNYLLGKISILKKTDLKKWKILKRKTEELEWDGEPVFKKHILTRDDEIVISLKIIDNIKKIGELVGYTFSKMSNEKIQNLFYTSLNKDEFINRLQTLARWIDDIDTSYFKNKLKDKKVKGLKSRKIVETYLESIGRKTEGIVDVWKDINDLASFAWGSRHGGKEDVIKEVFKKYDEHYPYPNYNRFWLEILKNFNKSLAKLLIIIKEVS